jgi:uncharacterized protein YjiS (DUF1127 family)
MTMLNTAPSYTAPTVRRAIAIFLARFDRLFNRWIAAVIAHRERQANFMVLRYRSDRDLKDIGVNRCDIDDTLAEQALARLRTQQPERF